MTAVTGAGAALAACGSPENQIIRFIPDEDLVPGVAAWKPSICPVCAAGCGLSVRVMDADVDVVRDGQRGVVRALVAKKLEGRVDHPVNRGRLCARGQAAIQVTYHPDRLRHPLKRIGARGAGQLQEVSWDEAIAELVARLDGLAEKGGAGRLAWLGRRRTGRRAELVELFLQRFGAPAAVSGDLFDEPVLCRANLLSFGREQMPTFDLANARFVVSFGADFLTTWNSPVAQAAAYGEMRQGTPGERGSFVQVEARMSTTGANADRWVPARPGTEGALALGLAHVIMRDGLARADAAGRAGALVSGWSGGLAEFTPARVEALTGVPAATTESLARRFGSSQPSAAIVGGPALAHTNALPTAIAVNALNALVGSVAATGGVHFTPLPAGGRRAAPTVAALADGILSGRTPVDVLLLDDANVVFTSPKAWRVKEAIERVPFVASFGSFVDETSGLADLMLPDHTFLEGWIDAAPESGALAPVVDAAPPAMRPLHATRATVDVLLDVSRRLRQPLAQPLAWKTYEEALAANREPATAAKPAPPAAAAHAPVTFAEPVFDGSAADFPFHLLPYASVQFGDGSTAHLPWLQELPDPLTSAMWSNWIEVNPATATRLGLGTGDMVEVASSQGSVRAPVVITPGIAPDVVAMPVGQGHESYTRFASGRGSNPLSILAPSVEAETGALAWAATRVKLTRVAEGRGELILFAGSDDEHPHEHR